MWAYPVFVDTWVSGFRLAEGCLMAGQDQVGKRRKFTAEYRVEAARLVIETERPIAHVARELGIGESLLGRWVQAERARQAGEPTGELSIEERAELKRLRREVAELRKDNECLGKAAAFFASKPPRLNGLS